MRAKDRIGHNGKGQDDFEQPISETDRIIGDLLARMRHDGCGGKPQFAELITGIPGASRPVRRIVLIERADR